MSNDNRIRELHDFAWQHGEAAFAHMCSAALNGEQWAIERVTAAMLRAPGMSPKRQDWADALLIVIRTTDTTPPGGGALRSL